MCCVIVRAHTEGSRSNHAQAALEGTEIRADPTADVFSIAMIAAELCNDERLPVFPDDDAASEVLRHVPAVLPAERLGFGGNRAGRELAARALCEVATRWNMSELQACAARIFSGESTTLAKGLESVMQEFRLAQKAVERQQRALFTCLADDEAHAFPRLVLVYPSVAKSVYEMVKGALKDSYDVVMCCGGRQMAPHITCSSAVPKIYRVEVPSELARKLAPMIVFSCFVARIALTAAGLSAVTGILPSVVDLPKNIADTLNSAVRSMNSAENAADQVSDLEYLAVEMCRPGVPVATKKKLNTKLYGEAYRTVAALVLEQTDWARTRAHLTRSVSPSDGSTTWACQAHVAALVDTGGFVAPELASADEGSRGAEAAVRAYDPATSTGGGSGGGGGAATLGTTPKSSATAAAAAAEGSSQGGGFSGITATHQYVVIAAVSAVETARGKLSLSTPHERLRNAVKEPRDLASLRVLLTEHPMLVRDDPGDSIVRIRCWVLMLGEN